MFTVLLRFTLSFVHKVYIGFLSRMRDWTVLGQESNLWPCDSGVVTVVLYQLSCSCRALTARPCYHIKGMPV